jgi:hypothetical protein
MSWFEKWRENILRIKREYEAAHESLEGWCQRLQRKAAFRSGIRYPGGSDPITGVRYLTARPILTALDARNELVKNPTHWPFVRAAGDDFWDAPIGSGFIVFFKGAKGKGHVALCIREERGGKPVYVMYDTMKLRRMGKDWAKRVVGAYRLL